MDKLKAGIPVKNKTCENTVAKQYNLGQKIGVKGTPAIFLEDGTLIPGYKPAKKLIRDILAKSGK
jgi:thiol:disulfide interchange protein DsbC